MKTIVITYTMTRQKRAFLIALSCIIVFVLAVWFGLGLYQLVDHGWAQFVLRSAGTGASP